MRIGISGNYSYSRNRTHNANVEVEGKNRKNKKKRGIFFQISHSAKSEGSEE
jgi:hypothetical protein